MSCDDRTEALRRRLAEAEDALHNLMIGESVVTVTTDDRTATFTAANSDRLRAYIHELKVALGEAAPRRALRFSI